MDKILNLDSVDLYNKLYGLETLNPLVSVIDLNKATSSVDLIRFTNHIIDFFLSLLNHLLYTGRMDSSVNGIVVPFFGIHSGP